MGGVWLIPVSPGWRANLASDVCQGNRLILTIHLLFNPVLLRKLYDSLNRSVEQNMKLLVSKATARAYQIHTN